MEKEKISQQLGSHIRDIRISKKITQQTLADKADLSLPFVNFIENGKRTPSLVSLIAILDVFKMSLSDFFEPFSQHNDRELNELLLLLEKSPKKDEYVNLFIKTLQISQNS